jgi:hypothetical protein
VEDAAALDGIAGRTSLLVTTERDEIAKALPAARLDVLPAVPDFDTRVRAAMASLDTQERELVEAAVVCAPAALDAQDRLPDALAARGILTPHGSGYYALHECARRALGPPDADAIARVARALCGGRIEPEGLAGLWRAFGLAASQPGAETWQHASRIASRAIAYLADRNRTAERFEWLRALAYAADVRGEFQTRERCLRDQAWILRSWGREQEAEELLDQIVTLMPDKQPSLF